MTKSQITILSLGLVPALANNGVGGEYFINLASAMLAIGALAFVAGYFEDDIQESKNINGSVSTVNGDIRG